MNVTRYHNNKLTYSLITRTAGCNVSDKTAGTPPAAGALYEVFTGEDILNYWLKNNIV
jgi:hypothetical protein